MPNGRGLWPILPFLHVELYLYGAWAQLFTQTSQAGHMTQIPGSLQLSSRGGSFSLILFFIYYFFTYGYFFILF